MKNARIGEVIHHAENRIIADITILACRFRRLHVTGLAAAGRVVQPSPVRQIDDIEIAVHIVQPYLLVEVIRYGYESILLICKSQDVIVGKLNACGIGALKAIDDTIMVGPLMMSLADLQSAALGTTTVEYVVLRPNKSMLSAVVVEYHQAILVLGQTNLISMAPGPGFLLTGYGNMGRNP